jgi:Dyp-type peroxidase family
LSEEILRISNIQGNVVPGFNKDFQAFIFLRLVEADGDLWRFRRWLQVMLPFISTSKQVLAFNQLYKRVEACEKKSPLSRHGKPQTVQATWMNIAFSYRALSRLTDDANAFRDEAFKAGLANRSPLLGDPTDPAMEGHPRNWVVGGNENEADVVLIIASDDRGDLLAQIAWVESTIDAPRTTMGDRFGRSLEVINKQLAAVLPDQLSKNEHFGFRDGISQPGVRGRLSETPGDYLTPSETPNQKQGKAGQDLVWTGEFLLGYYRQRGLGSANIVERSDDQYCPGPDWATDGSYVVIRRLRQDVRRFLEFFDEAARRYGAPDSKTLQSLCVGRRPSGEPLVPVGEEAKDAPHKPVPDQDPTCPDNEQWINFFEFADRDPHGEACPFAAHIRKVYPRDDESTSLDEPASEVTTQTHRLLRRGIPFGDPYNAELDRQGRDNGERGLMFVAYQASIERQFEFVTRHIVNNPAFRVTVGGLDPGYNPGYDPIIGQNGTTPDRVRDFTVVIDGRPTPIRAPGEWVIPTGGGYFFAPSIPALRDQIARTENDRRSEAEREKGGAGQSEAARPMPVGQSGLAEPSDARPERCCSNLQMEGTMATTPDSLRAASSADIVDELVRRITMSVKQALSDQTVWMGDNHGTTHAVPSPSKETTLTTPDGLGGATDSEIVDQLAQRIATHVGQGHEDTAEALIKSLLQQAGVQRFLDYWILGDFIYGENPYFAKGQSHLIYSGGSNLDPSKIRRAGILKANNSSNPYSVTNPGQAIPKPPALGGPRNPAAWYHRLGQDSDEVFPGSALGDGDPRANAALERNIIKEIEIEYAPPIVEGGLPKPPHLIIMFGGGDH